MLDVRLKDLQRLEKEVLKYDASETPEGMIMFYGDSSFTRWGEKWGHRPLAEDIRMKNGSPAAVNRGFGTSTAEEQLYYYPRMIRPYNPRALVLQTFGNDTDLGYSPSEILFLQSRLMQYARHDNPGIKFYICDVRPLVEHKDDKYTFYHLKKEYNELLKEYCDKHEDCTYVCHTESPLFYDDPADVGTYNKIRTDIFVEDKVHYNQKGYDLYKKFFLEILDDIL